MSKRINGRQLGTNKTKRRELAKLAAGHRVTHQNYLSSVRNFLESLDCPRALTVWLLFANNEHSQLSELKFNSSEFDYSNFVPSYRATLLFAKHQRLNIPGADKKRAALEKFVKYEDLCRSTNRRFRNLSKCHLYTGDIPKLHEAIRVKIARILGTFDVEEFLACADWGPGASTFLKGWQACAANKFQHEVGITRDLSDLLNDSGFFSAEGFSPGWSELRIGGTRNYVGNRLEFVPKTSVIDRPIAKEPGLNLWFQKAVGTMIRRRLGKWGVNLNSQSINQRLAYSASISNELATIDFSSASDSIAKCLVEELIPPRWHFVMNTLRSHYGELDSKSKPVLWEKFSSMGNGFTFELESLIFFATALCVCEEDEGFSYKPSSNISVYGDDVILPSCYFSRFSEVCSFYGFVINEDKSFINSDFRESCGEHYFRGISCKPIYLKDRVLKALDVFLFHNEIARMSLLYYGRDRAFKRCLDHLRHLVPKALRLLIPDGCGDGGFISSFDEARPPRNGRGFEGFSYRDIKQVSIPVAFDGLGLLLSWFRGTGRRGTDITVPSSVVLTHGTSRRRRICGITIFHRYFQWRDGLKRTKDGNYATQRDYVTLRLCGNIAGFWQDLGPWM